MSTKRPAASAALLSVVLELGAVGVMTLIAGASDDAANVMLIMMGGFWLMFAILESNIIYNVVGALRSLATYPSNNAVYSGVPGDLYENYGGAGNNMYLPGNVPSNG